MCGFVGVIVPRTGAVLRHRGPDGRGTSSSASLPWAHVNLEMTRLAIVDRRAIDVPFDFRESCGIVLAFNGEIYNHRELHAELSDGTPWQTECDAEVVARAWRRWGPAMLDRMNGMWGLALVDERLGVVFLARDRAGEKPLYYTRFGRGLAIASEMKALPIDHREVPCADADVLEFDCLEATPFEGVHRLGPGQSVILRKSEDLAPPLPVMTWWALGSAVDDAMTWPVAVDETAALVEDSVRIRAVSEVPVGVQVSGGLDSAIVQAVVKSDRCYTVTFPDDGVDNLALARVAAGREPTAITFARDDLLGALRDVAYHLDTPATWTAVCQWFLNRQMAADGCVIVLSGEGADELFGGYARYRLLHWLERAAKDERLAEYRFARERLYGSDEEILARLIDRSLDGRSRAHAQALVRRFATGDGLLVDAMRVDFYTTMQVLLRMADRMAAAFSLENRSVFFDYRLLELAARMPTRFKVTDEASKAVLCEVARRLGVPEPVVEQKTKRGLFVPPSWWGAERSWDRRGFAVLLREAWRAAFFGEARVRETGVA